MLAGIMGPKACRVVGAVGDLVIRGLIARSYMANGY
ncbi:MAG: hypothetical protein QOD83_4312 [Solirubrobacteraceae bacterium]|jgi:hypothetical protein|nr:hypothetical protein [Solirubrobacteraceae bacterium]